MPFPHRKSLQGRAEFHGSYNDDLPQLPSSSTTTRGTSSQGLTIRSIPAAHRAPTPPSSSALSSPPALSSPSRFSTPSSISRRSPSDPGDLSNLGIDDKKWWDEKRAQRRGQELQRVRTLMSADWDTLTGKDKAERMDRQTKWYDRFHKENKIVVEKLPDDTFEVYELVEEEDDGDKMEQEKEIDQDEMEIEDESKPVRARGSRKHARKESSDSDFMLDSEADEDEAEDEEMDLEMEDRVEREGKATLRNHNVSPDRKKPRLMDSKDFY